MFGKLYQQTVTILRRQTGVFALRLKLIVLMFFTASLTLGQSAPHRHPNRRQPAQSASSSRTKSSELVRFTEKLRSQGGTVIVTKEKVSQPFFSPAGRVIKINGEVLQVFEYATISAANADASKVSADGTTVGTSKPSWMATPHFFKSEKLIVLYVGRNQAIVELVQRTLGNQFAGG